MANTLQAFAESGVDQEPMQDTEGVEEGVGRENKARFAYWRKAPLMPNGLPSPDADFIVVGPAEDRQLLQREEKGMSILRQYGFFQKQNRAEGWDAMQDSWKRILLNGGAKEFPVKQIVEMQWHLPNRLPRYARRVKFPQLKGVEIHDAECPACHKTFSSLEDVSELLMHHQQVAHAQVSQTQSVTRALTEAQAGLTGPLAEAIGIIKQQIETQGIAAKEQAAAITKLAESVAESTKNKRAT